MGVNNALPCGFVTFHNDLTFVEAGVSVNKVDDTSINGNGGAVGSLGTGFIIKCVCELNNMSILVAIACNTTFNGSQSTTLLMAACEPNFIESELITHSDWP
jgi:hypothetical protein